MSPVATAERRARTPVPACDAPAPADEHTTLEGMVLGAWEGLLAHGRCECPVCSGEIVLRAGRGSCRGCGSELE